MHNSPYRPGELPLVLSGRQAERSTAREALGRVTTFGEFGGPPICFFGPRGYGKTSLMRAIEQDADQAELTSLWLSCAKGGSLLADLGERLMADPPLKVTGGSVQAGLPGFRASVDLKHIADDRNNPLVVGALTEILRRATKAADRGLVLFIDEIHAADRTELAVLLNAVQILAGDRDPVPAAVFLAGLPSTPTHLTRAATFGERSTFLEIGGLDREDQHTALTATSERDGVGWMPDAAIPILDHADGYPHFLQLFGDHTWRQAPEGTRTLTANHAEAGIAAARTAISTIYATRWKTASPQERELLKAIADGGGQAQRSDIAAELGISSSALSVARERLIDKGLIKPAGHGTLTFTIPGFADYIQTAAGS